MPKRKDYIREHYIDSFNHIKNKYGEDVSSYVIPSDASLQKAIGYTGQFIVNSSEEHYRYNYYQKYLDSALRMLDFNLTNNRRIIHLDLGCGPGLFSWVVQDRLLKNYGKKSGDIELIGYDHAKYMIRLANLFHGHLPVEYNFEGYSRINKIRHMLKTRDFSDCDCIVTFGYVLVQVKDDTEAIYNFVKIIKHLFPANSCTLVAVDAFSGNRSSEFRNACEKLLSALSNIGTNIEDKFIRSSGCSWMRARLSQEK